MTLNLYDVSVPSLLTGLSALSHLLNKAVEHGIPEAELVDSRIYADMKPLTFQIYSAAHTSAMGLLTEIAGVEKVATEDNAKTVAEMQAQITKTVELLKATDRSAFDGKENKDVVLKFPSGERRFQGTRFVLGIALPNFYFHVTTAYDILRMKGVPLSKSDYLNPPQL